MSAHQFGKQSKDWKVNCGVLADPGTGGTLRPMEDGMICNITTATAGARTMEGASGYPWNFRFTVAMYSDGGNATISAVRSAATAGGVVLGDNGDFAELVVGPAGTAGTKCWRVHSRSGCVVA